MKKTVLAMLAGAALAATPALAQFEGELTMKITTPGGSGTGRAFVSKAGARSELDIQTAQMPFKMTTLVKTANPDVMYMINDAQKTYAEMDLKRMREQAAKMRGGRAADTWVVKKLGRETVNGYSCEHVLVTRSNDAKTEQEWWTSKDVAGLTYDSMRGLFRQRNQADEGLMKALRDAGADGFVVRMVTREKGKPAPIATMELTKAERKSLPASLFEIPSGYTKQEGMLGTAGVMASPEAQEQMRKAMENMTPEQRKQIEDMMKARQQGQ
ncbi:MAG TPA: DUF4412 domain-containing protein [Thermoanaerobaculia bacterium]|nr:DUF4412 domain-containing protein [Thermoanaerobaculia bacterium]